MNKLLNAILYRLPDWGWVDRLDQRDLDRKYRAIERRAALDTRECGFCDRCCSDEYGVPLPPRGYERETDLRWAEYWSEMEYQWSFDPDAEAQAEFDREVV